MIKNQHHWLYASGKKVAVIIFLMGLLGALTVIGNYGFQKSRRADALARHILATSSVSTIVVSTYETSSQLRELVALALSFERVSSSDNYRSQQLYIPQFLLNEQSDTSWTRLSKLLASQPRPFDLWGVSFKEDEQNLARLNCNKDSQAKLSNSGYRHQLFHCR